MGFLSYLHCVPLLVTSGVEGVILKQVKRGITNIGTYTSIYIDRPLLAYTQTCVYALTR